ncbi:MAG TPA: efflux RND transporter periplasmic adaptor subunit [Polyangiaceae bacterium]|nr:efflux RND transporter periplasmic adaptor subunit [Polyangiaceae bacterium]
MSITPRNSHLSRTLLAALAPCLLSSALGLGCKRESEAAEPPREAAAIAVQSEPVTLADVPRTLRLSGTLRGDREVDLAANASGRVLSTAVERGERVAANQVIAKLDTRAAAFSETEAKAQAASARAQQEQAQSECERYERLKQKAAITDLEYLQKMTQCRTLPLTAEAAAARAQLAAQNVGDGVIRAPFAGIIAERYVEVGQYVRQDTRVVSLVSADPIRLQLSVPEADVQNVNQGGDVSFVVAAYPGQRFSGTVRFVSGVVRSTTRDLIVEALVPNKERLLMPGMFADVELVVGQQRLPTIPRAAVFTRDDESHAFIVSGNRLEERVLALGPEVGDRVAVLRGAGDGERVALGKLDDLKNGQLIAMNQQGKE